MCGRQSLEHLEAFLREQERLVGRPGGAELGLEGQQGGPPARGKAECCGCQQNSFKGATEQDTGRPAPGTGWLNEEGTDDRVSCRKCVS